MEASMRCKVERLSIEAANSRELRESLERDPLDALARFGFSLEEQRVVVGKLMVGELRFEGSIAIFGPRILSPWPPDGQPRRTITAVTSSELMRAGQLARITATLSFVHESDRILLASERLGRDWRVAGCQTKVDFAAKTVTAAVQVPEAGMYDVYVCNELGEPAEWARLNGGLRVEPPR